MRKFDAGIRHVIDTGVVKVRTHHPMTGLDMLKVMKISKEQAMQRMGRAGREAPGKCYRTYTQEEFDRLEDTTVPEIKRCNLTGVILQLLAIGIDITTFGFMDEPPKQGVEAAMKCLENLGAITGMGFFFYSNKCVRVFICKGRYFLEIRLLDIAGK